MFNKEKKKNWKEKFGIGNRQKMNGKSKSVPASINELQKQNRPVASWSRESTQDMNGGLMLLTEKRKDV